MIHVAIDVLSSAEESLRDLMGAAAKEGDYETVLQIAGWAKAVRQLLADSAHLRAPSEEPASATVCIADSEVSAETPELALPEGNHSSANSKLLVRKTSRAKDYPKYLRIGDVLVKLGWSKSQKAEYEHKAPFSVVRDLVMAIRQATSKKRTFVMEAILPLKSSADGQEVPSYQTYACLAWLRQEGLIVQHGRQGYTVKPNTELEASIQHLFSRMPERQLPEVHK